MRKLGKVSALTPPPLPKGEGINAGMRGIVCCLFLAILLVSCASFTTQPPLPTRQPVIASLPPALRPWGSRLQDCAAKQKGMDFFLEEASPSSEIAARADLAFQLGAGSIRGTAFATQVGWEDIVVIASVSNPLEKLSTGQLQQLFGGQTTRWEKLSPAPAGLSGEVHLWNYPPGDELRQTFEMAVFQVNSGLAQPMLAPDPQAMIEAVGSDPIAIGYIPKGWLGSAAADQKGGVKAISLEASLVQALHLPVLAISPAEPQGAARALLVCLVGK